MYVRVSKQGFVQPLYEAQWCYGLGKMRPLSHTPPAAIRKALKIVFAVFLNALNSFNTVTCCTELDQTEMCSRRMG